MAGKKPKQLAQEITDALRRRIMEGDLQPGEWLRQERIAREYDVSQMPVREALKRLETEGLVEHLPYRGIRVVQVSIEDAEDLFYYRMAIEGRTARFAALNMTWQELENLLEIREKMSQAIQANKIAEYQELNRSFHDEIIRSSGRPLLRRSLAGLWATYPSMLWPGFRGTTKEILAARFQDDEAEHDAIVEALKQRDPDAAEEAMRHHIRTSAETLLANVRSEPLDENR